MFASRMRKRKYVTMFDPFQQRYNNMMVALLYLAAIAGDVFWSASILAALGMTCNVKYCKVLEIRPLLKM